ncbi:MAG TPA: M1 family metallopeptidase, partial [candidate division Zixibacteria bacterium]|nr:M1 family metallopeptidase [candidate division Zixibacteria bacterium]
MGMDLVRGVVASGLLALSLSSPATAQVSRLDANVAPTFQRVHLTLDADAPEYSGEVEISLRVAEPTTSFSFHAEGMEMNETLLTGADGAVGVTLSETGAKGFTTATTDRELTSGDYTLRIAFTNTFDTLANSLYRLEVDGAGYSFTQFEADDAREAFPCWDEPSFKIPWQLSLTVPEEHAAVSNTPFEKESFADGWKTVTFERTPPLPSYLIAIATGPLEFVEIPGMSIPGRVVCVKGKSHLAQLAVEVTPPILAELERYFDSPYPFKKLDLIAVPEFWAGAMENPGAITYRETLLLLDPAKTSVSQRRSQVTVTAHELAHMWFGDLVTMSWWDDLWLNESFATWMGNKISERVFPEFKIEVDRARSGNYVMSSDARPSAQQIRQPITDPDQLMANVGAQYLKGEAVLNMFERWIGEEAFRQGVLNYLKEHEWSNAQAEDLWSALSAASGRDVIGALADFIERPGVPRVDVDIQLDGALTLT